MGKSIIECCLIMTEIGFDFGVSYRFLSQKWFIVLRGALFVTSRLFVAFYVNFGYIYA